MGRYTIFSFFLICIGCHGMIYENDKNRFEVMLKKQNEDHKKEKNELDEQLKELRQELSKEREKIKVLSAEKRQLMSILRSFSRTKTKTNKISKDFKDFVDQVHKGLSAKDIKIPKTIKTLQTDDDKKIDEAIEHYYKEQDDNDSSMNTENDSIVSIKIDIESLKEKTKNYKIFRLKLEKQVLNKKEEIIAFVKNTNLY